MGKRMMTANVPLPVILAARHRCAWKDCEESMVLPEPQPKMLPKGWRWLSLWNGPVGIPPWAPGCVEDRDAVLCPKHASQLHNELLEDIGQRLFNTEGSA